jgi:hypothetical protein
MTATALIGVTAAMIPPHRIAQVKVARIGGRANRAASDRTGRGAQGGVSGCRTNSRTACRADQGTTGKPVTGVGATTGDQQGRCKS